MLQVNDSDQKHTAGALAMQAIALVFPLGRVLKELHHPICGLMTQIGRLLWMATWIKRMLQVVDSDRVLTSIG